MAVSKGELACLGLRRRWYFSVVPVRVDCEGGADIEQGKRIY